MISVVIPAYNSEQYLEECIASLLSNVNGGVEVILVDDGSEDATSEICDYLAGQYPGTIRTLHKDNGGVQTARNLGYAEAIGDWVWFVDSDDMVAPGALERLSHVIVSTQADAVYFNFTSFVDSAALQWDGLARDNEAVIDADKFLSETYTSVRNHYLWEYLFRNSTLSRMVKAYPGGSAGPCDERFSLLEDLVFTEEFLRTATCIAVIPDTLYAYRQVPSSITHANRPMEAASALDAIRRIDAYPVGDGDRLPKALMQISLLFNAYRVAGITDEASTLRKDIASEISARIKDVGVSRLSPRLLLRYIALRTGIGDVVLRRRGRKNIG